MKFHHILFFLFLSVVPVMSQYLLPDTLWVKVTFYDFHSDGSNPNFEACNCGRKPGMIQDTLSVDRKPVLLADLCCNDRIDEWFRPSGASGSTFSRDSATGFWKWSDLVSYKGRADEWVGSGFDSTYDMADVVIYDSLPFLLFDSLTGTYEFVRNMRLNDKVQFFWLDGRGFGEETSGKPHNYSFTMELHHEFTYNGSEFFTFYGDDDAWVFINGQMVLDLGGMQSENGGTVDLNDLSDELGLQPGHKYMFDFFYTERQTPQSNIVITTNILTPAKPSHLVILPDSVPSGDSLAGLSDTSVNAGECLTLYAYVVDDTGAVRPEWSDSVVWVVQDSLGNPIDIVTRSASNEFCLTEAYGCVTILFSYQDPLFPGIVLTDTVSLCVDPGAPDHLVIEPNADSLASLRDDNPVDRVTLSQSETDQSVYAVLRDQYGNFIGFADPATWSSLDTSVVTAAAGSAQPGEGVITRNANQGTTRVIAAASGFADTIDVELQNISYTALRLVTGTPTLSDVDTLRVRSDQDTFLVALGLRSDNNQWDNVIVSWSAGSISFSPTPPQQAYRYDFSPAQPDTGTITITRNETGGTLTDQVVVIVTAGLPYRLVLYPDPGAPSAFNTPYPPPTVIQSLTAGVLFSATAKIFDRKGNWLTSLETVNAPIIWRVTTREGADPAGTLSNTAGAFSNYLPERAYSTVSLTAEFRGTAVPFSDTVTLAIRAGEAHHLVIEASPDRSVSPNFDNPLQSLLFSSTDTLQNVYAVLRDSLGNFVSSSPRTIWTSADTLIATVSSGNAPLGEGAVKRSATIGGTFITALNGDDSSLIDSVPVTMSNITYDSLRIVVQYNGLRDISSLTMQQGADTALYALGLRSDTRQWSAVRVAWSISGIAVSSSPPQSSDLWQFSSGAAGNGRIVISNFGHADTVDLQVIAATPVSLALYPDSGGPSPVNTPFPAYPAADTIEAGSPVSLYATFFSQSGMWLSRFESDTTQVDWICILPDGTRSGAPLSRTAGAINTFTYTRAYSKVTVIATYPVGPSGIADSAVFYIRPTSADHLVLESTPEWSGSPNRDNPVDTVLFIATDSVRSVYAVLRDTYGNFVSFANSLSWMSGNTQNATVSGGLTSLGEGRIFRNTDSGTVTISTVDNNGRRDSTVALLTTLTYDSLRIVTTSLVPISRLDLETSLDTTLYVQGRRDETGKWELVRADWALSGNLVTSPAPPSGTPQWTIQPVDTGSGTINVTLGQLSFSLPATFTSRTPTILQLYPKSGPPSFANEAYPPPQVPMNVRAGEGLTIVAKLLDDNGYWFDKYETQSEPFSWEVIEPTGFSSMRNLNPSTGFATVFTPTVAYRTFLVAGFYTVGNRELSDTIAVYVSPAAAHHLVIEANQNREVSPNSDNPLSIVTLTGSETYRRVYAVIRDEYGNWVTYSLITDWWSASTQTVTVESGITGIGEGILTKGTEGKTTVFAENTETRYGLLQLVDSVEVLVTAIWYQQLRIVNIDGTPVDSLAISTNDDTTLYVQGLRSDDSTWETIQAQWEISPSLEDNIAPPEFSESWTVSPSLPAEGWIRVTLGVDSITIPDSLPVSFSIGEPTQARIELLTPPEKRIAGDTIVAIVRIFNNDGAVPGVFCISDSAGNGNVRYYDQLQNIDGQPDPSIVVDGEVALLADDSTDAQKMAQCFDNGIDTVRFVVYHAPYDNDSLHRITVKIGGLPEASMPFDLNPAALDSLAIETSDTTAGDTLVLHFPDGEAILTAIGYDRFGNKRGPEPGNWTADGSLHSITGGRNASRVYYRSADVIDPEAGFITVHSSDSADAIIPGRLFVIITGPIIRVITSFTDDSNGNGYLDRILLQFSRPITLPDTLSNLRILYDTTDFTVDTIRNMSGDSDSDSLWIIVLQESDTTGPLQTAWEPSLYFSPFGDVDGADGIKIQDGAGPVIERAVKLVSSPSSRKKDRVIIYFSENVTAPDGNGLSIMTPPESLLTFWESDGDGNLSRAEFVLRGIETMQSTEGNRIEFYMQNGFDITSRYFVNINAEAATLIDNSEKGNYPEEENRRVRMQVKDRQQQEIVIYPNPSRPAFNRIEAGELRAANEPQAREWVMRDGSGTVISFKITTPDEGTVHSTFTIHDLAGNLVNIARNDDLTAGLPEGLSNYDITFYWNGSNMQSMPVSPGIYRVVVTVDYSATRYPDFRIVNIIGIRR